MMRVRADRVQRRRLITALCAVAVFLGFIFVYNGSIFGSQMHHGAPALEYGSRSLRKLVSSYLGDDEVADLGSKQDESSTKFGKEDGEDDMVP